MSKAAVTQAVYEYLRPEHSGIPNLGVVYTALPKVTNEADIFTNTFPGLGVGAAIYMFITGQEERRVAMGGPHDGRKFRTYDLGLLIVFKSDLPETVDGQAAFDEFIDNLTSYIQDDRFAGNPSVIFSWGEGNIDGGPDLHIQYTMPRTLSGGVTLFQAVVHISTCEVFDT